MIIQDPVLCCACFPAWHSLSSQCSYRSVSGSCLPQHSGFYSPPLPWIPLMTCLPCSTQLAPTSVSTSGFSATHSSFSGSALHISLFPHPSLLLGSRVSLRLTVTANTNPVFSETQYNRDRILVHMIKHVLAKMILTHFRPNEQLLSFCLVGQ